MDTKNGKNGVISSPYLTREEAAAYIRRSMRTIKEYTKDYSLPTYGVSGTEYTQRDLDLFMADRDHFLREGAPEPMVKKDDMQQGPPAREVTPIVL